MQTLKKYLTRPACLVLAIALLGSAVAAASLYGSPYELAKRAAFSLYEEKNFTLTSSLTLTLNGEVLDSGTTTTYIGGGNLLQETTLGDYNSHQYVASVDGGLIATSYYSGSRTGSGVGRPEYNVAYFPDFKPIDTLMRLNFGENMTRGHTYVKLFEAFLDLTVGDFKNYVATATDLQGNRTLSLSLTATQIPELYNLITTLIASESNGGQNARSREEYADVTDQPIQSANIGQINGKVTLDKENRLTDGYGTASIQVQTIYGEWYEAEALFEFTVSDYGSTNPVCPLEGFDEIFTAELFEQHYGNELTFVEYSKYNLCFSVDHDGRVHPESVRVE